MGDKIGYSIRVSGVVQGVGFRPFVHKQITDRSLCGWIRNTDFGAELKLEGTKRELDAFVETMRTAAPALAQIESIDCTPYTSLVGFDSFRILPSKGAHAPDTLIAPDIATCPDCLAELFDPADRRYRFPFINCTNCGPRFTIIRDIPYDRDKTTMAPFGMCPDCAREYRDIENRRYHAQPDCCPVCGPKLSFLDGSGAEVTGDPIALAQQMLRGGGVVAVKGIGGFHLACRADDPALADELRQRKDRDARPFALMCADLDAARELCAVDVGAAALLEAPERPIVLCPKRDAEAHRHLSRNRDLGIMLPYTPVHHLLLHDDLRTLIMTSANRSDEPIVSDNEEALRALSGIADGFLIHDRAIHVKCDDSVLWPVGAGYFARRSRGYAPLPVMVRQDGMQILACGAEQKASFTLGRAGHAFPAQHIGDLKNLASYENYCAQIAHFEHLFAIRPERIACDLHPDYLSTTYAAERAAREEIPLIRVQHHHAHLASCMADNDLDGTVIGLTWDGTGLGTDGTIWGGELLVGGYAGFTRMGSICPFRMPGGDVVTKEITRLAVSLMHEAGCAPEEIANHLCECFDSGQRRQQRPAGYGEESETEQAPQIRTALAMLRADVNAPVTTSMGRLFDGAAAILGICKRATYEGEAAILLEAAADPGGTYEPYPITFYEKDGIRRFDTGPMIRAMLADVTDGNAPAQCAGRFMQTLAEMAVQQCRWAAGQTGCERVVLTGGTFQNRFLLRRITDGLEEAGLIPYRHRRVSANDEGISLGQLMIAGHTSLKEGAQDVPRSTAEN